MKRFLLLFFATTTIVLSAPAHPTDPTYTEHFDYIFQNVSRVQATTGILYERVVPFANLTSPNLDTSNYTHFIQAYSELYRAAFDTFDN